MNRLSLIVALAVVGCAVLAQRDGQGQFGQGNQGGQQGQQFGQGQGQQQSGQGQQQSGQGQQQSQSGQSQGQQSGQSQGQQQSQSSGKPCIQKQGNNVVFTGECKFANVTLQVKEQRVLISFNASQNITNDLLTPAVFIIGGCATEAKLASSSFHNTLILTPGILAMEFPLIAEAIPQGFGIVSQKSRVEHINVCKPEFQKTQQGYTIDFLFATGAPLEFTATIYNATISDGSQNDNTKTSSHNIKWNIQL